MSEVGIEKGCSSAYNFLFVMLKSIVKKQNSSGYSRLGKRLLLSSPHFLLLTSELNSLTSAAELDKEAWSRAATWLPPDLALQCSDILFFVSVFAKNFRVNAVMKTSVLLSWEVPDSYKSAVPFKVRVRFRGQEAPPVAVSRTVDSSINWALSVRLTTAAP